MTKPLVYLAGPISGLNYAGATDWRNNAAARLEEHGIIGLSPMRAKDHLKDVERFGGHGYETHAISSQRGVFTRDRFDVRRANPHDHIFLLEAAGYIVPTLDEALAITISILGH
jgi:hypothetical protein